jgi:2-polyprenyl-3-methyl-5-hydroxy-6-metoxy-1,4-benzoquinol methylase
MTAHSEPREPAPRTGEAVSALSDDGDASLTTAQQRYHAWQQLLPPPQIEYLLPRIDRDFEPAWPDYMAPRDDRASADELARTVESLAPWSVPYRLAHGLNTMNLDEMHAKVVQAQVLYRRELITGTVAQLLGDELASTNVLDVGCNAGFFSLDIAGRGAQHVDGIDLRAENIAQARFAAEHYGFANVDFHVSDVDAFSAGAQWDVVLNLGVLYHVTNPIELLQRTYELCRKFAVIDSVCHREPVSAYFLFSDKDVTSRTEGRSDWEFHPTYRGAIDTIRHAGFSRVVEVVGQHRPGARHPLYQSGQRRCFVAFK